ncbi:vesicular glutamate transporter 3-like [Pomacea canaliculata]|uniref:vesicular glutamate transporter 3-like n=1 Tax=Pomacea canaliculata TaxID=400727 RepID=UPI000D734706|nr:vesicular glutamate transporter 3-like [Pomacea canaliculata]XP_025096317.1 vesicular glutamate transporter 3-like [Pomacea canaliculata]
MAFMMSFVMILGNGFRPGFAVVMTHITSNYSANGEGLLFPLCTTLNTSRDLSIDMSVSTVFYLHATYLLGNFIFRFPAGIIATCLSPSKTLGIATLLFSLVTMAIPLTIQSSVFLLFVARLLAGALEGFQQPISDGLLAVWSSPHDLSRLTVLAYSGCYIGAIISFLLTGSCLCYISWDSIFYIYALAGLLWCIVWFVFCARLSRPTSGLVKRGAFTSGTRIRSEEKLHTHAQERPLARHSQLQAGVGADHCHLRPSGGVFHVDQCTGQYFHDVYGMNSADIGLLAALPYLVMIVAPPWAPSCQIISSAKVCP